MIVRGGLMLIGGKEMINTNLLKREVPRDTMIKVLIHSKEVNKISNHQLLTSNPEWVTNNLIKINNSEIKILQVRILINNRISRVVIRILEDITRIEILTNHSNRINHSNNHIYHINLKLRIMMIYKS